MIPNKFLSMSTLSIDWNDKVAVITGGANGIGLAIVKKCLSLNMKVVIADINEQEIQSTINQLNIDSSRILGVKTDVSKYSAVEDLASKVFKTFGRVDFLFNNAGVADSSFVWESSLKDWEWVLGVNLYGVIHGIKALVPEMIKQDTTGYINNTSSLSGLLSANLGIYSVSKHAVVSLSETLYQSLQLVQSKLQVAVFCPGFLKTNINTSERNRPEELQDTTIEKSQEMHPELLKIKTFVDKVVTKGMDPALAVDILFKELEEGKFYIQTHKDERTLGSIKMRMEGILSGFIKT